jgi:hypothetical protein
MEQEKIAELAAQVEPDSMQDRFIDSVNTVSVETKAGKPILRTLQSNFVPSDIRRDLINRLPNAFDRAEELAMGSDKPAVAIQWADTVAKYSIGTVKGVTIENRDFARMVMRVIMEELGVEALDKCVPKIEMILTQLQSSGE